MKTGLKAWAVGTASAPMVTVGLGSSMRDLTTDEVVEFVRDLSRAYYQVHGALPPAVRRSDIGAGSHTRTREQVRRATEAAKRWNEKKRKLKLVRGGLR